MPSLKAKDGNGWHYVIVGSSKTVAVDDTLKNSGEAADAKVVGDAIDVLNETIANKQINMTHASRLIPDDMSEMPGNGYYIAFSEFAELNDFVESVALNMDYNTQKTYGVVCDFDPFNEYGVLTISVGYNGDGFSSAFAKLEVGDVSAYRLGYDGESVSWEPDWIFNYHAVSVAEEYTYDNWRVRKWSNGECELWATVEATANLSSWGSVVYMENAIPAQTYPVTFASIPQVQVTPIMQNEYVYGLLSGTVAGTVTTSPSFCVWRANSASASIPVCVDLYIKGTLA